MISTILWGIFVGVLITVILVGTAVFVLWKLFSGGWKAIAIVLLCSLILFVLLL